MVRRFEWFVYGLLTATALLGVVLWGRLPDPMAIHFSGGDPNTFVPKPVGVVLAPVIGIGAVLIMQHGPAGLSRRYESPAMKRASALFAGSVVALAQLYVYAWNLGYRFPTWMLLAPVFAGAAVLIGYRWRTEGIR
ncbi:MAG: DUF1648 domain-containing protein [Halobacteriales archaeon]|nr:DUF1648 domain-containing protein [Halobacteriales archaeon]